VDFTMKREVIQIKSVKYRTLEKGYGYVRITQFQERTDRDVKKAMEVLVAESGGSPVWSWIFATTREGCSTRR